MKHIKATFFLPVKDNDGRDLAKDIAEVEDAVYRAFSAWTFNGYRKGVWRMQSGDLQMDVSAEYSLILPPEQLYVLRQILETFKSKTRQEVIYLEVAKDIDLLLI